MMYRLYQLKHEKLPENTFILTSDVARKILFNPSLAGKKLQDLMDVLAIVFAKAVGRIALKGVKRRQLAELVLLAGGLFYSLNKAFKRVHGFALSQCFLGIKRFAKGGGRWVAKADYNNFEALPDSAVVLIGDTIASGATIDSAVLRLEKALENKKYSLEKLIVCSLACSSKGAERIALMEKRLKKKWPGCRVYLFACEELFHVMPDGTDLRFLEKDAIMPRETRTAILRNYGFWLGREMRCAVFDWGTRCKQPELHYNEVKHYAEKTLGRAKDAKARRVLKKIKIDAEKGLKELEKRF